MGTYSRGGGGGVKLSVDSTTFREISAIYNEILCKIYAYKYIPKSKIYNLVKGRIQTKIKFFTLNFPSVKIIDFTTTKTTSKLF